MSSAESSGDRLILRRVHKNHYKPGLPIQVLPVAFRPNKNDADGISVFLSEADGGVSPQTLVDNARNPDGYIVVAFRESELGHLGLTVFLHAAPDSPRGHAVIPEINWREYAQGGDKKQRIKELTIKLAELASQRVVYM